MNKLEAPEYNFFVTHDYDGVTTAYLDGEAAGSDSDTYVSGIVSCTSGVFYAGRYYAAQRYFSGYLDDIRIYNRVLSASEINLIFNATR